MMIECVYITNNNVRHYAASGITSEDLPTEGIGTGSSCLMLDKQERWIFHAGTGTWYLQPSEESGGGYTPVRGVDYWTEEDIASIKAYVDEAILGGAW